RADCERRSSGGRRLHRALNSFGGAQRDPTARDAASETEGTRRCVGAGGRHHSRTGHPSFEGMRDFGDISAPRVHGTYPYVYPESCAAEAAVTRNLATKSSPKDFPQSQTREGHSWSDSVDCLASSSCSASLSPFPQAASPFDGRPFSGASLFRSRSLS